MTVNLNSLARDITLDEGKAKPMTIAQIKEVLKLVFDRPLEEISEIWLKYQKRK